MTPKFARLTKDSRFLFIATLAVSVFSQINGYSDEIDTVTTSVKSLIFGGPIRKAALVLGLGGGLFQAFMAGSIRPLLIYGGLGLAVCYLPAVIDLISGINTGVAT